MRITKEFLLNEISKIYKYIEDNPNRGAILGPVTSALVKLHKDINILIQESGRAEVAKELVKLKAYIKDKMAEYKIHEERKRKIIEANRGKDKNAKELI